MSDVPSQTNLFAASSLGSFWWVADVLYRHGPTWSAVPPVLIGLATLIGAVRGYLNDRQQRRHAEERHRARMARRDGFRLGAAGLPRGRFRGRMVLK